MDNINGRLSSLQEISKLQLSRIFGVNSNKKYLILQTSVIKPLERVCGVRWIKDSGVDKIFKLEETPPDFQQFPTFYMIYASVSVFRKVVDQIRSRITDDSPKNQFHIIVVPRCFFLFEEELEELGLCGVIKLHSFQWQPIYLDTGILSLEIPQIYPKLFLQKDLTLLPSLSKILWHLFFVVGKPKYLITLGELSGQILAQLELFEDKGESDKLDSDFGGCLIIDRSMDYVSTFLTPGTYTALLNEVYGIKSGFCEFKEEQNEEFDEKFNPVKKKQPIQFILDSTQDRVYNDIKNRYFTEVTSVLSQLTKQLKGEKINSTEMALDEIKKYVQHQLQATKLKKKFITNHLNAAESIINNLGHKYENLQQIEVNLLRNLNKSSNFVYLEENISMENCPISSLRLFCLFSITQKLTNSEVKQFWRKYLQQFGYQNGYALRNLIEAEFVYEQQEQKLKLPIFNTSNFYINANKLKQIPTNQEKINLKFPTCCSYVFGGCYIPLITQIASMLLNSTPLDEIKTKLENIGPFGYKNDRGYPLQPRSLLIFVIGGLTYAEVAACNLLENITGAKITLLSDRMLSGNDIVGEVLEMPK